MMQPIISYILINNVHNLKNLNFQFKMMLQICDSRYPNMMHPITDAIDGYNDYWWQSPSISQGDKYHYVTITIDLKQVSCYYVIIGKITAQVLLRRNHSRSYTTCLCSIVIDNKRINLQIKISINKNIIYLLTFFEITIFLLLLTLTKA